MAQRDQVTMKDALNGGWLLEGYRLVPGRLRRREGPHWEAAGRGPCVLTLQTSCSALGGLGDAWRPLRGWPLGGDGPLLGRTDFPAAESRRSRREHIPPPSANTDSESRDALQRPSPTERVTRLRAQAPLIPGASAPWKPSSIAGRQQ